MDLKKNNCLSNLCDAVKGKICALIKNSLEFRPPPPRDVAVYFLWIHPRGNGFHWEYDIKEVSRKSFMYTHTLYHGDEDKKVFQLNRKPNFVKETLFFCSFKPLIWIIRIWHESGGNSFFLSLETKSIKWGYKTARSDKDYCLLCLSAAFIFEERIIYFVCF